MKMNILIIVALSFISLTAHAGLFDSSEFKKVDNPNQPIEIVLEAPGKTKSQLYSYAKSWIAESHIAEITDADKDSGRIVSEAVVGTSLEQDTFGLRIDSKDGKIKLTYSNFYFRQLDRSGGTSHGVYSQHDLNKATAIANQWGDSFSKYIKNQSDSEKW